MAEIERLMAIRAALLQTTGTLGWSYIKQMAKNIVTEAMKKAMAEKDRTAAGDLTFKAAALNQGFEDLFNAIETSKSFGTEQEPDWFSQLNEFEELADGRRTD